METGQNVGHAIGPRSKTVEQFLESVPYLAGQEDPWPEYERLKRDLQAIVDREPGPRVWKYTEAFRAFLERTGL